MILVTLGTQDKSFKRLLKAVEKEKINGNIKEKVVVQAGYTKYKSDVMEIFDTIPKDEFEEYMSKASLVITHGGVGSILTALDNNKKVIAVPRLKEYKEHNNNHQCDNETINSSCLCKSTTKNQCLTNLTFCLRLSCNCL